MRYRFVLGKFRIYQLLQIFGMILGLLNKIRDINLWLVAAKCLVDCVPWSLLLFQLKNWYEEFYCSL